MVTLFIVDSMSSKSFAHSCIVTSVMINIVRIGTFSIGDDKDVDVDSCGWDKVGTIGDNGSALHSSPILALHDVSICVFYQ